MAIKKNVASQYVTVFAYDSTDGTPKTGDAANITAYIAKDAGGAIQTNDVNPDEVSAANMKGAYRFTLAQAETNADMIVIVSKSSTADIEIHPFIGYTEVLNDYKANVTNLDVAVSTRASSAEAAVIAALIGALNNPSTADIADAVLEEAIADHKTTAGSLAEFVNNLNAIAKYKFLFPSSNVTEVYDADGITKLFTVTFTDGVGRVTT